MGDLSAQKLDQKRGRTLTPQSFQQLLIWLDDGTNSDGQKYLEMRRRLVAYFDRKNVSTPDELAEETLNRVAGRLEEEGITESDPPAKYCYIVARFVFMEHLRARQKTEVLLDGLRRQAEGYRSDSPEAAEKKDVKELMLNCLEQCLDKLEPLHREIITRYYVGKERVKIENRRALAESLGITQNALSIRACRIREKLEACVKQCAGGT